MKSHPTSVGNFFLGLLALSILSGCTIKHIREQDEEAEQVEKEESGEVSLSAEAAERQALRKDIPEPVRVLNDERAVILQLMVEEKDSPELIRMRFDTMLTRLRNEERKSNDKKRVEFTRAEKTKRDAFLKSQKEKRDEFNAQRKKKKKYDREEYTQFFADLEIQRKDFFAEEREKRQSFESEMRQQNNDFQSRTRSWQNEFNQEHRLYKQKWDSKKNAKSKEREDALRLLNKPQSP